MQSCWHFPFCRRCAHNAIHTIIWLSLQMIAKNFSFASCREQIIKKLDCQVYRQPCLDQTRYNGWIGRFCLRNHENHQNHNSTLWQNRISPFFTYWRKRSGPFHYDLSVSKCETITVHRAKPNFVRSKQQTHSVLCVTASLPHLTVVCMRSAIDEKGKFVIPRRVATIHLVHF